MEFLDFFTTGLVGDIVSWLWGQIKNVTGFIGAILAFWGLIDVYMLYRSRRAENIDKTAAVWNWFNSSYNNSGRRSEWIWTSRIWCGKSGDKSGC